MSIYLGAIVIQQRSSDRGTVPSLREPRTGDNFAPGGDARSTPGSRQNRVSGPKIGLWSENVEPMSLVLLGCRVIGPAALSPPAKRRALRAAEALRAGMTQHILACGGKAWDGVRESDALCAFLREHGVDESALEREAHSHSTRENAHYAAQLLLPRGISRVWLVTCDWHMPRALRSFAGAGFRAEPLPALSPPIARGAGFVRATREHVCLALDALATRGFSRV